MFALEIFFSDGVSQPETILIRRPQAVIGSSDFAHVVVDDMNQLGYQIRVVRDIGRRFRCIPIGAEKNSEVSQLFEGVYEGSADFDLGVVKLHLTAIDYDMAVKDGEPPDRAGVRVLRQGVAMPSPLFPAVVVQGATPVVVSFVPGQPILIGRSKKCALRLDSADISAEHARVGYESGEFWIEDLGSTNGTFLRQQQVSGRATFPPGEIVILGREVSVLGVTAEDQIRRATHVSSDEIRRITSHQTKYPLLLSVSELVRPARVVLAAGTSVTIGRDPSSDIWVGAPHVSRKHCSITVAKTGIISINDSSMNGTAHDGGVLKRGESLESQDQPRVLDFGGGVTVALCFNPEHERQFIQSQGSVTTFVGERAPAIDWLQARAEAPDGEPQQDAAPRASSGAQKAPASLIQRGAARVASEYQNYGLFGKLAVLLTGISLVFLVLIVVSFAMNL